MEFRLCEKDKGGIASASGRQDGRDRHVGLLALAMTW